MGKRAANKIRNEQEIVEKAIQLFISKGDESTTISDIVAETSLAFGTFYNYFRNKREIWDKIMANFLLLHAVDAERGQSKSIYEFIHHTLFLIVSAMHIHPYRQLLTKNPASFRAAYFRNEVVKKNVSILERDMRESPLFKELEEDQYKMTAYAVLGACFEILVQSSLREDQFSKEQITNYLASLFEKGLLGLQQ